MLFAIIFVAAAVAPALCAVTSGLYLISSKYFLADVITQNADGIFLEPADQQKPGQLWSVAVRGTTATIVNVGTHAFLSVDSNGTVVPSHTYFAWTLAGDISSAAIETNGQQVAGTSEHLPLVLGGSGEGSYQIWNFVPVLPPGTYRLWNQAKNLYLDQVLGECQFPEPCVLATVLNTSSTSQVWHVGGTSPCGGKPTLQNAASGSFLASGTDFTNVGTAAVLESSPYPWTYGFVGGEVILVDEDLIEDITTLTVFDDRVDLYASAAGPGTAPNQTWVFRPV